MRLSGLVAAVLALHASPGLAQECPLTPAARVGLPAVLQGHDLMLSPSGSVVGFRSKLARDEDGMPTAYHRGFVDDRADPGADHICVGGDVLELRGGKLVSKYSAGGTVGDLKREDGHALQCKRDYIAIRDAGFPACGPGHLCMRWYGVEVEPRSCGFDRTRDKGCGVPIRQRDASGNLLDYYMTSNKLRRAGAKQSDLKQSDYADASTVPFVALPGGVSYPTTRQPGVGDYVAVIVGGRIAYGVYGDIGPANKLGEASRALLSQLARSSVDEGDAYTVLLPGSSSADALGWPLTASAIRAQARQRLSAALGLNEEQLERVLQGCAARRPNDR